MVESLGSPVFLSVPAIRPSDQPVVDLVVASSSHFTPDIKQQAPVGEFEELWWSFVVEGYTQLLFIHSTYILYRNKDLLTKHDCTNFIP